MTHDSLADHCIQVVTHLTHAQRWPLNAAGVAALASAILPHVEALPEQTEATIQRVAFNFYQDGPMVQQMYTPSSAEGERLWAEWRAYMVSLGRSRGLSHEDAEELAQDVYSQTVKALQIFHFGSRLKTYFCGIFINCYRHWVRSTVRRGQREEPLPDQLSHSDDGTERELGDNGTTSTHQALEEVEHSHLYRLVVQEVERMISSADFQILRLYYVEQTFIDQEHQEHKWTDKEIGEYLGLPLNTVTSRRLRALKRLQNQPRLQTLFREIGAP